MDRQTIVAYSGGSLPAAIGICRISGPEALAVGEGIFQPQKGGPLGSGPWGQMRYGQVVDERGRLLDLCLACCYPGPHSYTGEDMVEIFCHGSRAVVAQLLDRACQLGARPAQAGEFTRRAFLAGKLDLTGAEGVADLIEAQSPAAARNAAAQLKGGIAKQITALRDEIMDQLTHFYAVCDYPDEDLDPFLTEQAAIALEACAGRMEKLVAGFQRGRLLNQGVPITILGRPNGGKSSLLNALAGYERAIVTEEAGTTRDIVTEILRCGDALLQFSDTAGLRDAENKAEQIGIDKAVESARSAQLLLCVFDGSQPLGPEDAQVLALAQEGRAIAIINKADLPQAPGNAWENRFEKVFYLSAKTGQGLDSFWRWLSSLTDGGEEVLVTSARQAALLEQAAQCGRLAAQSARAGFTADAFLADAEQAARLLDEVLGQRVSDDIVHGIFSRFCVGK